MAPKWTMHSVSGLCSIERSEQMRRCACNGSLQPLNTRLIQCSALWKVLMREFRAMHTPRYFVEGNNAWSDGFCWNSITDDERKILFLNSVAKYAHEKMTHTNSVNFTIEQFLEFETTFFIVHDSMPYLESFLMTVLDNKLYSRYMTGRMFLQSFLLYVIHRGDLRQFEHVFQSTAKAAARNQKEEEEEEEGCFLSRTEWMRMYVSSSSNPNDIHTWLCELMTTGVKLLLNNNRVDREITLVDDIVLSKRRIRNSGCDRLWFNKIAASLMRDFGVGVSNPAELVPCIANGCSRDDGNCSETGQRKTEEEVRIELQQLFCMETLSRAGKSSCPLLINEQYGGGGALMDTNTSRIVRAIHEERCQTIRDVLMGRDDRPQVLPVAVFHIVMDMYGEACECLKYGQGCDLRASGKRQKLSHLHSSSSSSSS